jgi:hypothetical protein
MKEVDEMKTVNVSDLKDCVVEAGFSYLNNRPVSQHPGDWYLRFVLAFRETQRGTEYVTWLYNATLGDKGSLNTGHYIMDRNKAYTDYQIRE